MVEDNRLDMLRSYCEKMAIRVESKRAHDGKAFDIFATGEKSAYEDVLKFIRRMGGER